MRNRLSSAIERAVVAFWARPLRELNAGTQQAWRVGHRMVVRDRRFDALMASHHYDPPSYRHDEEEAA